MICTFVRTLKTYDTSEGGSFWPLREILADLYSLLLPDPENMTDPIHIQQLKMDGTGEKEQEQEARG